MQFRFFSQATEPAAASASTASSAASAAPSAPAAPASTASTPSAQNPTDPKVYVSNLNWRTSNEDLQQLFSPFGKVVEAYIVMDRENPNRSRGFGFVTFSSMAEADKAVASLDQKVYLGRTIKVNISIPKPRVPRPSYNRGPPTESAGH
jgi:nucleolin